MLTVDNSSGFWLLRALLSYAIANFLTAILIPRILLIAFRKNLFDHTDDRKIHHAIVPRLGGIAFFPSIFLSTALVIGCGLKISPSDMWPQIHVQLLPVIFGISAIVMIFFVGLADDLTEMAYLSKFKAQIIAALLIVISGTYVSDFYGFCWITSLPAWLGMIISVIIVICIVNAINLIDGIDGLAAGLCAIALVFYAALFFIHDTFLYSILAISAVGALMPFFYFNVFGNPHRQKKIFMGDTGTLTMGFLLSFCALVLMSSNNDTAPINYNPIVMALSPLAVPCLDAGRVCIHRLRAHRNIFLPDRCHIHHKFLNLGFSQLASTSLILTSAVAFIILNLLLSPHLVSTLIVSIDILLWTIGNILLTAAIRRRERHLNKSLYN